MSSPSLKWRHWMMQKSCKICLEFGAFEKLFPEKAAGTRSGFPRLTVDRLHECETGTQSVRAVVRDCLSQLERTRFNFLNRDYLVHESDPRMEGTIPPNRLAETPKSYLTL